MKRTLILALAVLMLVFAPAMLLRAEAATIVDSGTCGENVTWTLDSEGTLTISGTGDMEDYDAYYWAPWDSWRASIRSVVVGKGVTSIHGSFSHCVVLRSVTLPERIAGFIDFSDCISLKSIAIPEGITYISAENCTSLSSITLPESLTSIDDAAFRGCTSLESITIPDSVTSIGSYAFYDCASLSSITIPEGVTRIEFETFYGCYSLKSITIPDSVTYIGEYAFSGCSSLSSIKIPAGVTFIGYDAFSGCGNLEKVEITDIGAWCNIRFGHTPLDDVSSATNPLGDLYLNGELLTNIVLPDSVTGIYCEAFYGCDSLTSITIPEGVTSIGDLAFCGCYNLSSITLPESVLLIRESAFGGCGNLKTIHYAGTQEQAAEITILSGNGGLEDAIWHYECSGINCTGVEGPFGDVAADAYYFAPVLWAVNKGITNGLSADTFGPEATCTRGQIVTFLWRANGSPEPKMVFNPFSDVSSEDYFYDAVLWAVENGITGGMGDGTFAPGAPCTRGQVATFLWRAEGQPYSYGENIFSDISYGAYYYDAVLWAVENGITNGMGEGIFAPDATCTRGQIVTFLYRAM